MKWFKHYSDNHRGQGINKMLDELKYFGPFFYYTIYEICNEKLEKDASKDITKDDCVFRLHRRVVCSATRAKPSSVDSALVLGQSCGFWSFTKDEEFYEIKIPILFDLLESDQKKTRHNRAKNARKTRLDKELDKEEDKDKDKDKKINKKEDERISRMVEIWNASCSNYGLSKITSLNAKRKKGFAVALEDVPDPEDWRYVFTAAIDRSFIKPDGKHWKPTIDYILKPGKALELLEEYNNSNLGADLDEI